MVQSKETAEEGKGREKELVGSGERKRGRERARSKASGKDRRASLSLSLPPTPLPKMVPSSLCMWAHAEEANGQIGGQAGNQAVESSLNWERSDRIAAERERKRKRELHPSKP
jgi:hypothetical protein